MFYGIYDVWSSAIEDAKKKSQNQDKVEEKKSYGDELGSVGCAMPKITLYQKFICYLRGD